MFAAKNIFDVNLDWTLNLNWRMRDKASELFRRISLCARVARWQWWQKDEDERVR